MRNRVPPRSLLRHRDRPAIASQARRTALRPTPRPDVVVTSSRVEKPSAKRARARSSVVWCGRPRAAARRPMASQSIPRPSSATSIVTRSPARFAASSILPGAEVERSDGLSSPWSTALRRTCVRTLHSGAIASRSSRRRLGQSIDTSTSPLPRRCARERVGSENRSSRASTRCSRHSATISTISARGAPIGARGAAPRRRRRRSRSALARGRRSSGPDDP